MQLKYRPAVMSSRVAAVTLEAPEELALTDAELMLIVDSRTGVSYDHAGRRYQLNGESFGSARHFGGHVETLDDPASKLVTVFID